METFLIAFFVIVLAVILATNIRRYVQDKQRRNSRPDGRWPTADGH
jgi:hypothetical protein